MLQIAFQYTLPKFKQGVDDGKDLLFLKYSLHIKTISMFTLIKRYK